ncbi:MAG: cyclic nucleotide-binding domain-containing protein [Anaerolineae bacterium]|nr:cyclic nucleotide-binding domain-containing protein [Anaerolineae bacterium]
MPDKQHLATLKRLFPSLSEPQIEKLLSMAQLKLYPPRKTLCRQGEPADRFYILLTGTVGIYAEIEDELYLVDKIRDGCFGEIGLLLDQQRSAFIYTRDDTTVLELDQHSFNILSQEIPQFAIEVSKMVIERMIEQDKVQLFKLRSVTEKAGENTLADVNPAEDERWREWMVKPVFGPPSLKMHFMSDVLMIMPFGEKLDPVYNNHIKKVATGLGLNIKRADDFFTQEAIISEIWAAINLTKLVIADCTGRNPNVFYEMGIAHTIGKPVIVIT